MPKPRKFRISDEAVFETILQMCAASWPDETVRPEDIAMTLHPIEWQALTKRIRLAVKQLAEAGLVQILRKGKPAEPDDFKGVYRLQIAESFWEPTPATPPAAPTE
ncbi:MAG: DUF3253 domain-containing protein [Ardenticatenaceae bacterium]|nr:DUF3253 domain-containing protein [Anaerolineales bacterium]MCB8976804.1 DUF3253 domain-containing protein [Ardenticatenaceae bacterium]